MENNYEYKDDAKDCQLAKSGNCCYCKNIACYKLEEQIKLLKAENTDLKKRIEWLYSLGG